jgi:DNA mismatch repair ATPase MutS
VNRELCNVVSKGTFKPPDQSYEPRYVLALRKFGNQVGVCFFDVTTLEIKVGQFVDNEQMSKLRTLVCQIRPIEVLHEREFSNSEVLKMFKNSAYPPVFTALPPQRCWSFTKTVGAYDTYFPNAREIPAALVKIRDEEHDLAVGCFGMTIAFL